MKLLLLVAASASIAQAKEAPSNAAIASLVQTVAAQDAKIKALERQISRSTGSCAADADDPEPELQTFRSAERLKRAQKRQEDLITLFSTTVRACAAKKNAQRAHT